jgi:hypothetical protein
MENTNLVSLDLTSFQATELAYHFVTMFDSITKFFEDPKVKKDFEEWHLRKFGRKPNEASV